MAVHLSGRQRDFLTDTFPRPPGDGWTFVSRSDAPATRPNTHRIPSAHPFVLFVSFAVPAFLHGDRDATASSPPAITGSSCRFAASDEFIA